MMARSLIGWSTIILIFIARTTWSQTTVKTIQVTSLLNLDTSSYSKDLKTTYCNQFITELGLAISVDRSRFTNPSLTSSDSSTSYISFIILPPTASTDLTSLQVYSAYNTEIHKVGSTLLNDELASHIDLTATAQVSTVTLYQCSDGSYVSTTDTCQQTSTTAPSSIDSIDGTTLTIIEAVGGGVIVATIFLAVGIAIRRRQRLAEFRKNQLLQQAQTNGIVMAKIISTDDVIPSYQNPYRETQSAITTSIGGPPPYSQYSPPISTQGIAVGIMAQPVYAMAPVQQGFTPAIQSQTANDPSSPSMGTETAKQSQAGPSRIVKKGMNLKQIRQKRIGLDAPQVDQGDESMPDTDTDF